MIIAVDDSRSGDEDPAMLTNLMEKGFSAGVVGMAAEADVKWEHGPSIIGARRVLGVWMDGLRSRQKISLAPGRDRPCR